MRLLTDSENINVLLNMVADVDKDLSIISPESVSLMYRQYQHLRGKYVQQLNELVAKYSKHLKVVEV